ncbi:glutamate receptor 2.9-like isoform X1 [Glycine soja]|uniref:glutamate receptor 2.9-like isoform X1 n=1 Tax=Glycine soja TaxID=3848 RepID=UPI00103AD480|nr:glutamate receptor 2.9-like isoform X1 [Glycine soja]
MAKEAIPIPIGIVLDLNSSIGSMSNSCIWMAYQDFYERHPHYKTRLALQTRDSRDNVVTAASVAQELLNEKVHAIIGPQTSEQAWFVIELGSKAQVPVISFSATSPSLSSTQKPYFIRAARDDSSQVEAIAAIVQGNGWREIIPIYEDTEYGNGLNPYLNDAFVKIGTRVPYRSVISPGSGGAEISNELKKLKLMSTKVFLVHMSTDLGCKVFLAAKKEGMMTIGYAWIVTEGLSAEVDPMVLKCIGTMQGVLGVRPSPKHTKRLDNFKERYGNTVTIFGLWAYDSVWALAKAVEKVWGENVTATLHNTILATKFHGLSGNFHLVKGQLEPSILEVFNVVEQTERSIGNWMPERGLSKLEQPKWPGNTTEPPAKLRIGIPPTNSVNEFKKFLNFSFDVFFEVLKVLPFPLHYELLPFEKHGETAGTYDELLMQIKEKKYDAVVGDVTIVAKRSEYVDFTMPFSESGVAMLVLAKHDERQNIWIFLKPFSWDLWLTTGAAFIFTGFIVWFFEHRSNTEFRGTPKNQIGMALWFSFSTLVFAHREKVENKWSRFVLIIWFFVVLIITQSYTASLASILTVQKLQPQFMDVEEIKTNNFFVGYHKDSFVKGLLIEKLGFNESKLKGYHGPEAYQQALSLGSNNGGVAAVFDEIVFINLFLMKYGCKKYQIVGPTYKTDGFAFAFPRNSPLVPYFSRSILNVTENKTTFDGIKKKYFSRDVISEDPSTRMAFRSTNLTLKSFGGLFIIILFTSFLAVMVHLFKFMHSKWTARDFQRSLSEMMTELAKHFNKEECSLHPPQIMEEGSLDPDGTNYQSIIHNEEDLRQL